MKRDMVIFMAGLFAVILAGFSPAAFGQPPPPPASSPAKVSDGDLHSFVRTYVETQKIRQKYEAELQSTTDAAERRNIQQQASEELQDLLDREGLTVDDYNRVFATVDADEGLRVIVLRMIEDERDRSQ